MEISQISLALFISVSFIFGFAFGFLYDFISPLPALCGKVYSEKLNEKLSCVCGARKKDKRVTKLKKIVTNTAVFLHDVFYMICFGAAFATLTYVFNDGIVRFSSVLAATGGLVVYKKTVRKWVLSLSELIRLGVFYALRTVIGVLAMPFKAFALLLKRALVRIRKSNEKRYALRYGKRMRLELITLAEHGFLRDFEQKENKKKGKYGYERRGKKEKNNNFCDLVHSDGISYCVSGESDELQPATQGSNTARAQKRRA